ncbi:hypothetical protein ACWESM_20505 [Nocardia sp. NPDC003999]
MTLQRQHEGRSFAALTVTARQKRDWLLLRHHSSLVAHGRCFGRGDILSRDGALIASFAQEGLLRFRP